MLEETCFTIEFVGFGGESSSDGNDYLVVVVVGVGGVVWVGIATVVATTVFVGVGCGRRKGGRVGGAIRRKMGRL